MENQIGILYNDSDAGFAIHPLAYAEYLRRIGMDTNEMVVTDKQGEIHLLFYTDEHEDDQHKLRTDPILIELYKEWGNRFNGTGSHIVIGYIPKKYEHHFTIKEANGYENILIEYDGYFVDEVKKIVDSNKSAQDKIRCIQKLYKP